MADFPRLLFKDGLTTISDISAGTKMGILFAFVLTAQTKDGHTLLHKNKDLAHIYVNMIQAFEMLLCYWAWLKKDEFWECNDEQALQAAQEAIKMTTNQLITLFPQTIGSTWRIPKMHKQLHIGLNIYLFGAH